MSTVEDVLTTIGDMTVLELAELLKAFEEKFDVTAAAPVAMAAAPAAADTGPAAVTVPPRPGGTSSRRHLPP